MAQKSKKPTAKPKPTRMDYDTLGWIKAGKNRRKFITLMKDRELTPTEIAKAANWTPSSTSKTLREFKEKEIISQMNPKVRKGKIFTLTRKGNDLLRSM